MKQEERNDIMFALIQAYLYAKESSKVWGREIDNSYSYARGRLSGACMAFELDYEETELHITMFTQKSQKAVLIYDKVNGTCEMKNK